MTYNKQSGAKGSDAEIHERWTQALGSLGGTLSRASANAEHLNSWKVGGRNFLLPIVVIPDGTLWAMDYEHDGSMVEGPKQVEDCTFFINRTFHLTDETAFTASHLHFMTESRLQGFAWDALNSLHATLLQRAGSTSYKR